jgi:hypothetical protein
MNGRQLVLALGRLRRQGLVTGGKNEDGVLVWNLTPQGFGRLGERSVFRPERKAR